MTRIGGYSLHGIYPSVLHLDLHLENEQRITFNPANPDQVQQTLEAASGTTKLMGFFRLCTMFPAENADLTYDNCPTRGSMYFTSAHTHNHGLASTRLEESNAIIAAIIHGHPYRRYDWSSGA